MSRPTLAGYRDPWHVAKSGDPRLKAIRRAGLSGLTHVVATAGGTARVPVEHATLEEWLSWTDTHTPTSPRRPTAAPRETEK